MKPTQLESDKYLVHMWFKRLAGNRLIERTARGKAMVRRHYMRTHPYLFTKAALNEA